MARFTQKQRQQIIEEFCKRRNRDFDARLFAKEVREKGKSHPAYEWFEWNGEKAAEEYRIWQARQFASGLKVSFKVETVSRAGPVRVREVSAPLLVSHGADRKSGGGYTITDITNPAHMGELCRQAAEDLRRWLRRYDGAIAHAGIDIDELEQYANLLDKASPPKVAKKPRPGTAGQARRGNDGKSGARRSGVGRHSGATRAVASR